MVGDEEFRKNRQQLLDAYGVPIALVRGQHSDRRQFLRRFGKSVGMSLGIGGSIASLVQYYEAHPWRKGLTTTATKLRDSFFGLSGKRLAFCISTQHLIQGMAHNQVRSAPPEDGQFFFENGLSEYCGSILPDGGGGFDFATWTSASWTPGWNTIIFGASVSNRVGRAIFGSPFLNRPLHHLYGSWWNATLDWAMFSPKGEVHKMRQYGKDWVVQGHQFVKVDGKHEVHSSYSVQNGIWKQENDFLLLSVLPGLSPGTKSWSFAGLHSQGSRSARIFLDDPTSHLDGIKKLIRVPPPYFQALFHVEVADDGQGGVMPAGLRLLDAARVHAYSPGGSEIS